MESDNLGRVYSDGAVVFVEGDQGDGLYVIQKGKVKISKHTGEDQIHIATLGEGEIFGEMALFDRHPRSATATSFGESRLLKVDKGTFLAGICRDPTLAFKILEAMSARTRRLNTEYMRLKREKFDLLKAALDLKQVCGRILEEAREVVEADNGSIMLLASDGKTLEIVAAFGKEQPRKVKLKVGDGIAGQVLETGQSQMVNNVSMSPQFKPGGMNLTSLICVPLIHEGRRLGVINLSTTSERLFNVLDLKHIQNLSNYTSIAVQNITDVNELKEAAESLAQIFRSFCY